MVAELEQVLDDIEEEAEAATGEANTSLDSAVYCSVKLAPSVEVRVLSMNVWWCNQSRDWREESSAGVVRASDRMERLTYRETVNRVKKGDLIVHYRKPDIYAISRAKEDGHHNSNLPEGYESGWEFKAEYIFLHDPIHREKVRDKLATYSDKHYAINPNGWIKQGYFLPFDIKGLKVIRNEIPANQRPDWLKNI
jgi:hypothetical protein